MKMTMLRPFQGEITNSLDWAEKYRPKTLSQITGNSKAIEELLIWAQSWLHGIPKERAVVLYGRAGTGKTSSAHALANDMGWEVIELNASDQRTPDIIMKIAGSASRTGTLDGSNMKKLVILDEADNIHGTADRGGEKAIIELIKKTRQPVILIANELYNLSAGLRSVCKPIQFSAVMARSMISALKRVTESEGITCGLGALETLAENANGDLRSAINDLQAIAQGKSRIEPEDIITAKRDTKENIFKVLEKIFKGKDIREAHKAMFNLDENPEDFIQWLDENIPFQYTETEDLEKGYYYLSRAATFLGRVSRRQNFNMWRYAGVMMTAGIVVSRSHDYTAIVKFQPPSLWRKLGQTKVMRNIRDSIARKIGAHCHVSMSYTRSQLLPFFRTMMKDNEYAPRVAALLALEPEEIAFLMETKSVTKKVKKTHEEAKSLTEKEFMQDIEVFGGFGAKPELSSEEEPEDKPEVEVKKEVKSQSSLFDF